MKRLFDISIIGGGIAGTTLARECARRFPGKKIAIFEQEKSLFSHNSSRNSGVIHSGVYYTPGSMKAHVSVEGQRLLMDYCKEKKISIENHGKLILPRHP